MDTKTLIYMLSGVYIQKGKVVKVRRWLGGVVVETSSWLGQQSGQIYHFNSDGIADTGTYECGPWELDDMPFASARLCLKTALGSSRSGIA
jgi:hypothetical protein